MARTVLAICCGLTIAVFVLFLVLIAFGVIPPVNMSDKSEDPRAGAVYLLGIAAVLSAFGLTILAEDESDGKTAETDAKTVATVVRETPDASKKTVTVERT